MVAYYRSRKVFVIAFLVIVTFPAIGNGQSRPFEDLGDVLDEGDPVSVESASGTIRRGRLVDLSATAIEIESNGGSTTLSGPDVAIVTRLRDSFVNGAIIGAAVFGIPTAVMAAGCDSYCGTGTAGEKAGAIAGTMALGAVVGVGIDALFGRERIVYRGRDTASAVRVVPIVDSRKTAVRVTIGF